jgi:hypothetical protein
MVFMEPNQTLSSVAMYSFKDPAAKLDWDEVLRGFGLMCMEFQMMESVLKASISELVAKDDPVMGSIITAELSVEGLLDLLYAVWEYRWEGSSNVADIDKILKRCAKAKKRRNELMHSEWYRNSLDGEGAFRFKAGHCYRNGFRINNEKITPAKMNAAADELRRCRQELAKFIYDHRPKC